MMPSFFVKLAAARLRRNALAWWVALTADQRSKDWAGFRDLIIIEFGPPPAAAQAVPRDRHKHLT
ncbi:hypothetical protein TIFTF001_036487 [Ficus carica]|uniref:Uncharacterized protein n=1 Tax=Ficus carica TaxID=3494 RepID=A0AA88E7U8_FICCA|nr:hypothetical protein TIFTF001_036487 [Ficus carica]